MCGAVEWLPAGADRSLGWVAQGLARCVKAGRVKKYGLASKGSALRQKVWGPALKGMTASMPPMNNVEGAGSCLVVVFSGEMFGLFDDELHGLFTFVWGVFMFGE